MRSNQLDTKGVRTVVGTVAADGSILQGVGFTVQRTGTGVYLIRLSRPMRVMFTWLAVCVSAFTTVTSPTGSSAQIAGSVSAGSAADSQFSFSVTGY